MPLINAQLRAGLWQGVLTDTGPTAPDLRATYLGDPLDGLQCEKDTDGWRITLPLPADILSDGVQTVIISTAQGETLATIPIICGALLEDDLRAEIALLRSELALLQKAFRKHCG